MGPSQWTAIWYQNTLWFILQQCQYLTVHNIYSRKIVVNWKGFRRKQLQTSLAFAGTDRVKQWKSSVRKPVSWLTLHLVTSQTQKQYVTVTSTCSFKAYVQVWRTRGKKLDQAHRMTHRILTHVRLTTEKQFNTMQYEDNKHNSEVQDMDMFFLTICISFKSFTKWQ